MGQLWFTDESGRKWMCGYDNSGGGFFAQRENNVKCANLLSENYEICERCTDDCPDEFDVMIGFAFGVKLEELIFKCREYGFNIRTEQIALLKKDCVNSKRPVTQLQRNVRAMFDGIGNQTMEDMERDFLMAKGIDPEDVI